MIKLTILIPVFNRVDVTIEGLKILNNAIEQYINTVEISKQNIKLDCVVIDDKSPDNSGNKIHSLFDNVTVLYGTGNLFWTGSINLGAKYAIEKQNTDGIILWNDDTVPELNYFIELNKIFNNINEFPQTIYGSLIKIFNTDKTWSAGGYFNSFWGYRRNITKPNAPKINWLTGMGTIIPKEIIIDLNYWDFDNFPQYFGDIDFTLRASKILNIQVNNNLVIYNKVELSSFQAKNSFKDYFKSLKIIQSRYNIEKEYKFLTKHCKTPMWMIYFTYKQIKYFMFFIRHYLKIN